jgi:hypothetical protein
MPAKAAKKGPETAIGLQELSHPRDRELMKLKAELVAGHSDIGEYTVICHSSCG